MVLLFYLCLVRSYILEHIAIYICSRFSQSSHIYKNNFCLRKAHTKATQEWLDRLAQENVYVLVCLTYADKLYAELMSKDGRHLNRDVARCELQKQKEVSFYNYTN